MTRNLKVLGVALAAMFAICAMTASAAFAQGGKLTTDGGVGVTLDATDTGGEGANALTAFGSKVECPESHYVGHRWNVTPHELIPNEATTATINPTYTNCTSNNGESSFPTTVQMNGCDYVFHVGETVESKTNTYGLTADLVCPEGEAVQIEAFLGGSHGFRVCTDTIPPQPNLTGAHGVNTGGSPDDIGIIGTFHSIEASQSGLCGSAETAEAELDIDVTVTGTNAAKEQVGITLSH